MAKDNFELKKYSIGMALKFYMSIYKLSNGGKVKQISCTINIIFTDHFLAFEVKLGWVREQERERTKK